MACLFGHRWNGCKCEKCGRLRNRDHAYRPAPGACVRRCSVCGAEQETHDWDGQNTCRACGLVNGQLPVPARLCIRRVQHTWIGHDSPCPVILNEERVCYLQKNATVHRQTTRSHNTVLLHQYKNVSAEFYVRPGENVIVDLNFRGLDGVGITITHNVRPEDMPGGAFPARTAGESPYGADHHSTQ